MLFKLLKISLIVVFLTAASYRGTAAWTNLQGSAPSTPDCNNIAVGKPAYASAEIPGAETALAVDGNPATLWNTGSFATQWIEIDLGSPTTVEGIRLKVAQYPNGNTTHEIWVAGGNKVYTKLETLTGYTSNGQILSRAFSPGLAPIRWIRIVTTASPSWVAWYEIQVCQTPLPVSTPTSTSTSTFTSTPVLTATRTVSATSTTAATATSTPSPSATPTNTPTSTSTPSSTPTVTASPFPTPRPVSGLLGQWKFDESRWAGDCVTADMIDSSGYGRHGIACINGNAPYPVPGKFGNAGRFDGIYQYANMGPGFNFTSSFTATMWIALDDYNWCGPTGTSQHIIGTHALRTPIGNGRGWGIYWDCTGLAWELTNSTGSAIASYGYIAPSPFPENESWHHIALVYDSSVPSATLYWDGLAVYSESGIANVPSFLFNNGEPLTINGLPYAPGAGAPGKIDDTRVYNRPLSPEEMYSIYKGN